MSVLSTYGGQTDSRDEAVTINGTALATRCSLIRHVASDRRRFHRLLKATSTSDELTSCGRHPVDLQADPNRTNR